MPKGLGSAALDRIYRYRARWSARRIARWLAPSDRVLDIGAGDCHLDVLLNREVGCAVAAVDVANGNRTDLPLQIYDGRTLPYADGSFDAALLLFVLHHAEDPGALLRETMRVCRRRIIVFEDVIANERDRRKFWRAHWIYDRFLGIPMPNHEWTPERWAALGGGLGLAQKWAGLIGGQFGFLSTRHIMYVWEPPERPAA